MHHAFRPFAAALAALLALLAGSAGAAPGDLDSSFDGDGRLQTVIGTLSSAQDTARQADGKLVVAGFSETGGATSFAVVRYNVNGSLDTTFDTDGRAAVTFTQGDAFGQAVAIQSDGKILVAGYIGAAGEQFAVARLNTNGSLDTTFGTMGRVAFPMAGATGALLTSMVLRSDGRIVLAGTAFTPTQTVIAVAQLLSGGGFDTTFSGDGMAILAPGGDSFAGPVALQADGKVLVAAFNGSRFIVGRLNTNGTTDTGFGTTGIAIANIGASTTGESLLGMVVQPDQKIVVSGSNSAPDITIVRFTTNGLLDGAFGAGGQNNTSIGGVDLVGDLLLMDDGKLMVVGSTFNGTTYEAFLIRYTAAGLLDTTYGINGHVTLSHEAGSFFVHSGLVQPDGKIVQAGQYREHFGAMRVLGEGSTNPVRTSPNDLNADGRSDLLFQNTDGRIAAWLMNGTTPTATANLIPAGAGWSVTHTADLNGDAKVDILFRHTDGRVYLYLMDGLTVTLGRELLGAGLGWSVSHTADLNNDGRADLILRHTDGRAHIWLMNGADVSGSATLLPAGSGWTVVNTGDFNGDGRADLVFMHADGRGYIYLMDGTTVTASTGFLSPGSGWTVTHVGDFNGDGLSDLVFRHTDGRAHLFLMNATTFVTGVELLPAGTGWTVTHVGDLDANGRDDFVFTHSDGRAHVRLMNGTTVIGAGDILPAGTGWSVMQLLDLNGDGRKDIVFRNTNGSITVRLMNGLTTIGSANLIGPGGWTVVPPKP
jgi:uncharacterized delta-60 repeat protein